jgi:hypothetical protein
MKTRRPVTYTLQFRGLASELENGLRKEASAPGCALVTSLTQDGVAGGFVWAPGDDEAFLDTTLALARPNAFEERGTIVFARGHGVQVRGWGRLAQSHDPHLRHGTVVLEVVGGEGKFEGAGDGSPPTSY